MQRVHSGMPGLRLVCLLLARDALKMWHMCAALLLQFRSTHNECRRCGASCAQSNLSAPALMPCHPVSPCTQAPPLWATRTTMMTATSSRTP